MTHSLYSLPQIPICCKGCFYPKFQIPICCKLFVLKTIILLLS